MNGMRNRIEQATGDHTIYETRREEYETGRKVPFRVCEDPLRLTEQEREDIFNIGQAITDFLHASNELYLTDERVKKLLDTGKPKIFTEGPSNKTNYLFARPDIIITPTGFSICEIETSPFGLALADILNRAYRKNGHETLVDEDSLSQTIQSNTPATGLIVVSKKTASYAGQMAYLAHNVFSSDDGRDWGVADANVETPPSTDIYRGFYLSEYTDDPKVQIIVDQILDNHSIALPSLTPHMEEKAILALLWDSRFEDFYVGQLGITTFEYLKQIIPPTWVVGQEKHFSLGLPNNVNSTADIAHLPKSKRNYVLKPSGFSPNSSWAEGINFMQRSRQEAIGALARADRDDNTLYIMQAFTKATNRIMFWTDKDGSKHQMAARIRLTPYYSMLSGTMGKLVAAKATGCENTDRIHAGSDSINTAVS